MALWSGLAHDPLGFDDDDGRREVGVQALVPTVLQASWTFGEALRLQLTLPGYGLVDAPATGQRGAALGDLTLDATVPVWRRPGVALAVRAHAGLPTGTGRGLLSRGWHGGGGLALSSGRQRVGGVLGGSLELGFTASQVDRIGPVALGHTAEAQGTVWVSVLPRLRLGIEGEGSVGLPAADAQANLLATVHGFAQAQLPAGVSLFLGAGTGVVPGIGAPEYHVLGGLTWSSSLRDLDDDGVVDARDPCRTVPEDPDGFRDHDGCPDLDHDGDGILEPRDACPEEPETFNDHDDDDGCPEPNRDGDRLVDALDACPDRPGPVLAMGCPDLDLDGLLDTDDACPSDPGPRHTRGCPDRDGDGLRDRDDACPDQPAPPGEDLSTSDGCPKRAFVDDGRIALTEMVFYPTGSAEIDMRSFPLLDDVAALLIEHPEIRRMEVAGHTDRRGDPEFNLQLATRRAESVRHFLVAAGVEPERLTARGYGPQDPIDTNRTEGGRAANRRVEFRILERVGPEGAEEPPPR